MSGPFLSVGSRSVEVGLALSLLVVVSIPLFINLGAIPIQAWDESRLAINALEMYRSGDWLVTTYDGEPDLWNTKPPLLVWAQTALMHLIGPGEWAVRLPSAIAGFFTAALLLAFGRLYIGKLLFGLIAIGVLVTTSGFVDIHVTRTGDYDAMLVLFTTASALAFFAFSETRQDRFLIAFFVLLSLAVLTKGVSGLFLLPGIALYSLARGQLLTLLRLRSLYVGLTGFVAVVLGFYLVRELQSPGYLAAVVDNELFGRYLNVIEKHEGDILTYVKRMMKVDYVYWLGFVPLGLLFGFYSQDRRIVRLTGFATLMVVSLFAVISTAGTKLPWYSAPAYPFLALLVAVGLYEVLGRFQRFLDTSDTGFKRIPALGAMLLILGFPYAVILHRTALPESRVYEGEEENYYAISQRLRGVLAGQEALDGVTVLYDGYAAHQAFYIALLAERGIDVRQGDWKAVDDVRFVLASQDHVISALDERYDLRRVDDRQGAQLLVIEDHAVSHLDGEISGDSG